MSSGLFLEYEKKSLSVCSLYTQGFVSILFLVMRYTWLNIILVVVLGGGHMNRAAEDRVERATLAGGCFWCMESPFESLDGVISVTSGYAGGKAPSPSYEQVSMGKTDHVEAVQIVFDSRKISYRCILEVYWRQIDPTDDGGQFADRGSQYKTAIFYHDDQQRETAEKSKQDLSSLGRFSKPIVTPIKPFTTFYAAEEYHQNYAIKNPDRYYRYRLGSGREGYLKKNWGGVTPPCRIPNQGKKQHLTDLQYRVTQLGETEKPFDNLFWNHTSEGIYVDVVSGEALFSSLDKYDSGSGWPSFKKPLEPQNIVEKPDHSLGMTRVEIRSRLAGSHLGHVFKDGPKPLGLRYCINSAALRFVHKTELETRGYGRYTDLFDK